ncbi:MAG: acyl-CoA dehydrogenase family protein [Tenacibaculum sp.]
MIHYKKIEEFINLSVIPKELEWIGKSFYKIEPELNKLRQIVKDNGWWTPQLSKHCGGLGLSLTEHAKLMQILGKTPYGCYIFNAHAPDAGNMELLEMAGTATQKKEYLSPLVNGDIRSCFSMTEPDYAGSNPIMMGTTAIKKNGYYIINGKKWFTTAADGSTFTIVMAVTNPDEGNPYLRSSMIIVPTNIKGYVIERNIPIMGHVGEGWLSHSEISFNNVKVPIYNLLGIEGEGFKLAQKRLGPGRIHHCMRWMGICERAFDMMCKRALNRKISKTEYLGDKQLIQNFIAESRAEIDAAKLYITDTANKMEQFGHKETRLQISAIKFFAAGVLQKVIDRAIQVHGALGITEDTILSFFYREERGSRIYDGADEVHKVSLAKRILKEKRKNNGC